MSNFITFKKTKIHFSDEGHGDVILLLHGFLESLNMWNNLKPHLLKTHRVICVDLLGHGKTESLGYVHSMELMAEAVKTVLKHLKIEHVIVIGHSMGGYVALALMEKNQNLIKGICLANSTPVADSAEKKRNRDRAIKAVKENYKTFVTISIANLFTPTSRNSFKEDYQNVKKEALKTSIQSIVASLEGMKIRKDRLQLFRTIKVPKLVLLGKNDAILNYKLQQKFYVNSDINVSLFPDGHMSHIENKEDFTYSIMHFIDFI